MNKNKISILPGLLLVTSMFFLIPVSADSGLVWHVDRVSNKGKFIACIKLYRDLDSYPYQDFYSLKIHIWSNDAGNWMYWEDIYISSAQGYCDEWEPTDGYKGGTTLGFSYWHISFGVTIPTEWVWVSGAWPNHWFRWETFRLIKNSDNEFGSGWWVNEGSNFQFTIEMEVGASPYWGTDTLTVSTTYDPTPPPSSCPFLYSWNGTAYQYIAETMGPGGIGFPDASLRYDTRPPDPRDYIVLDADQLPAVDGEYVIELASFRDEVNYIDEVKLIAVDHPPGYDVYSPSVYTQIPLPFEYRTVSNPITPVSAKKYVYQWGQVVNVTDILNAVTYLDDFNYTVSDPNQFHTIELDFGDLGNLADISEFKLIIGGWLVIFHESVPEQIEFMKENPELVSPPYLEVINETGMWEAVGEPICGESFWGPNSLVGTRILMRDIKQWLKTSDYRLRINYWGGYMMDWIAVDITDTPHEETTFTEKSPIKADLWYKGGVKYLPVEGDPIGYSANLPDWYTPYTYDAEPFVGYFTRYGNVKPLLKESDDMFVITNYGDSIYLRFEEVPIPEGMERHYYLYIDGFYKLPFVKYLLNSTMNTVDPLPFHGMSTYPYPENETYPDDPIHQAYLRNWNTRYIGP